MFEFELVKKEEDIKPDFGPVGSVVDIRTYRRWLPNKKRRETFVERNTRVVDANLDLVKDLLTEEEYNLERSIMLDHMNKLLALPSGRSMWIAGTEANKKHPASSFNCSALAINRIEAFTTVFELLMLGTGVGFRVFNSDINKLPSIKKFDIEFEDYNPKDKQDRLEDTTVKVLNSDTIYVEVGDSRKGWIDSLDTLLRVVFNTYSSLKLHDTLTLNFDIKKIVFNFNSVRSLGERIKGFGGTASGHEALKTLLLDVFNIFNECPTDKLRSIDCLDICCAIAKGVVAGNTRRSALLCLFEEGDDLMANAKVDLFDNPSLKGKYYRIQSNNTEALGTPYLSNLRSYLEANPDATKEEIWKFIDVYKPSVKWIKERFKVVSNAGDPGFCNYLKMIGKKWIAVRKYRPNVAVKNIWEWFCDICSNPCFEIILSVGYKNGLGVGFCNLTTLPINKFVIKRCNNNDLCAVTGYKLDKEGLEQAIRLTVRIATRQTFVTMPRAELDDTQKAERLLGVSVTGWIQLFNKLDLSYTEQEELMKEINAWANNEADVYSDKLGVDRPLMVCCIKPEGTGSKVLGSSSGVHWDWAPYYINRIQMGANDALAKTLKEQGFSWISTPYDLSKIYPTVDVWQAIELFRQTAKEGKELIFNSSNAVLFEFPVNSGMVESQGSVSASRQLQNVLRFSDKYVDHMVSSTITAKEDEWDNLAEELHAEKNWSRFTNAAFLSYYSGNHPLLPNEEITEDVYNEMMSSFKDSEWVKDGKFYVNEELLAELEQAALGSGIDIDDVDLGANCQGACPTR
jgi:ribonucleoside-diphosphate reductase alpha chain/ribonucleoside-triphosphate reductase